MVNLTANYDVESLVGIMGSKPARDRHLNRLLADFKGVSNSIINPEEGASSDEIVELSKTLLERLANFEHEHSVLGLNKIFNELRLPLEKQASYWMKFYESCSSQNELRIAALQRFTEILSYNDGKVADNFDTWKDRLLIAIKSQEDTQFEQQVAFNMMKKNSSIDVSRKWCSAIHELNDTPNTSLKTQYLNLFKTQFFKELDRLKPYPDILATECIHHLSVERMYTNFDEHIYDRYKTAVIDLAKDGRKSEALTFLLFAHKYMKPMLVEDRMEFVFKNIREFNQVFGHDDFAAIAKGPFHKINPLQDATVTQAVARYAKRLNNSSIQIKL